MSVKYVLQKPIEVAGETLTELELREPTAKDIRLIGLPFGTHEEIDTKAVHKYICSLAAQPPSTVDKLGPADFLELLGIVVRFFGDSTAQQE